MEFCNGSLSLLLTRSEMEYLNASKSDSFLQQKWDAFLDVVGKCELGDTTIRSQCAVLRHLPSGECPALPGGFTVSCVKVRSNVYSTSVHRSKLASIFVFGVLIQKITFFRDSVLWHKHRPYTYGSSCACVSEAKSESNNSSRAGGGQLFI